MEDRGGLLRTRPPTLNVKDEWREPGVSRGKGITGSGRVRVRPPGEKGLGEKLTRHSVPRAGRDMKSDWELLGAGRSGTGRSC